MLLDWFEHGCFVVRVSVCFYTEILVYDIMKIDKIVSADLISATEYVVNTLWIVVECFDNFIHCI